MRNHLHHVHGIGHNNPQIDDRVEDTGESDRWQKREHYRHQYTPDSFQQRMAFRHATTSLGSSLGSTAGHMVATTGILLPLAIGQFVKDTEKKLKIINYSLAAAAVISEVLYAVGHSKKKHAREDACQAHLNELERNLNLALGGGGTAMGVR